MDKIRLKMQVSIPTIGKETMRECPPLQKSKHILVQGMWFKSLDLKTSSPRKAGYHGISRTLNLPLPNGPERPQCKV